MDKKDWQKINIIFQIEKHIWGNEYITGNFEILSVKTESFVKIEAWEDFWSKLTPEDNKYL